MASRAAAALVVVALACAAYHVAEAFRKDVGVAPALIRILFHDCFPQGCDASVLLTGNNSEQGMGPNLTLRPVALNLIESIRAAVHRACGRTVSCADLTVLATRDSLVLAGGPHFDVALGRRDALAPASQDLVFTLPAPSFTVPELLKSFGDRNLDKADLVSLSGAHTFGIAHCSSFSDRFTPDVDTNPAIDPNFAAKLKAKCAKDVPAGTVNQTLDVRTPDVFDNKYYFDLIAKQGLFKSDQGLIVHPDTTRMATRFSLNQGAFLEQFAKSMVKMSNMDLLTGSQGEIRFNCAVPNSRVEGIETASDEGHAAAM
uniref:Peroxidase n=1 Tax=Aegilops tauschii TaxID=37682 RepID=M8BXW9_AEGTA